MLHILSGKKLGHEKWRAQAKVGKKAGHMSISQDAEKYWDFPGFTGKYLNMTFKIS